MTEKGKKTNIGEDDGRVIANMNVDGMPWYIEQGDKKADASQNDTDNMGPKETRSYIWGMLKAAFLVLAVFAVGYFLFIVFCLKVWFV